MGLEYSILEYKNTIKRNGKEYIDLLSQSFNLQNRSPIGQWVGVNQMYIGRPDLISLAVYHTDAYADIICKVNGISNPFELNENDILFIPELEFVMKNISQAQPNNDIVNNTNERLNSFVDNTTRYQKTKSSIRSPHQQTKGDRNYVLDRTSGLVFY